MNRPTRSQTLLGLLLVAIAACSGPYPPPPETRIDPVLDIFHGVEFVDDYRWLEDQESAETRAWIDEQNAYAETIVGERAIRDRFRDLLRARLDTENIGGTRRMADYEYFTMRRAGEEAPVIYRRSAPESNDTGDAEDADGPSADGTYEVVFDPADIDPTYRTLVSMMDSSPDETLLMYSIRQGGADEIAIRIRNLETGEDLPDRLPNSLYGGATFDEEGTGFYYTLRSRIDGPRIWHHVLGEQRADDEMIWGDGYGATVFINMNRIADGAYRLYHAQHGWARNDYFIQAGDGPIRPLVEGVPAHFQIQYREGQLYIRTDWEASNFRLMVADPADPAPERWSELIPEGEDLLESYTFIDDRIYVTYLREVENRISVFEMDGTPAGTIDVPEQSSVGIRGAGEGKATLTASDYLTPSTEYELDLSTGERTVSEAPDDVPEGFTVSKVWVTTPGRVRAPMYVMHRSGIELDGTHPTILNGYGGFTSNIKPGFSAYRQAWLDAGGVFSVATLRGGTEFGEAWHQDGMLENKQHVFDDFIAAAEATQLLFINAVLLGPGR